MTPEEKKELTEVLNHLNDLHSELMDRRADIESIEDRIEKQLSKLDDCISDSE